MTTKPPVERPGVLRFGPTGNTVKRGKLKLTYYFCSEEELLYRVPVSIHGSLVSGELVVPDYADRRQRVLEVHVDVSHAPIIRDVRGLYYVFDKEGRLDLHAATEAVVRSIEGDKPQEIQKHVVDIGPVLRAKRWKTDQKWVPGPKLLAALKREFEGPEAKKVPAWRPSKAM